MSDDGLIAALARAQGRFPPITKEHTADAGKYKYQYADLADILAAVRPVLSEEGIAVVQTMFRAKDDGCIYLVTGLLHGTERLESFYPLELSRDAQANGSAITYARRYSLTALLGIAAEQDDDGAAATHAARRPEPVQSAELLADYLKTPLANMTMRELMSVASQLGHSFGNTGVSKAEAIRQLEPLVRAAKGEEPWEPVSLPDASESGASEELAGGVPVATPPPGEPFDVMRDGPGSIRKRLNSPKEPL